MFWRGSFALCLVWLSACQRTPPAVAPPVAEAPPVAVAALPAPPVPPALSLCEPRGQTPLDAASRYLDEGRAQEGLACAAQASALAPGEAAAHAMRGEALAALERTAEAQVAYARALALDPDAPEALLGAAHLYAVQLPSSREHDELGSLYAERGLALEGLEPGWRERFALLASIAFNDLGRSGEALQRARLVLQHQPTDAEASYEEALALFELCEFAKARVAFSRLTGDEVRGGLAHHHLGLLLEREGKWAQARVHFDKARALSPEEFPAPPTPSEAEFREEVARAVAALPEDMRRDLTGVPVRAEELPAQDDLLSGEPPLSPTILGLFRGPSLREACDGRETPCRSVALYRLNLARAVRTREELREQIKVTLLHEVGHLRGEDDQELAARGLE